MHISINTEEGLSDLDKQILAVLAGGVAPAAAKPAAKAEKAEEKPKPAAKAKATKKPEPEPEPEPEEEEAPEEEADEESENTLEDAVALATKMVSNGEAAKVKSALGKVGAKKVSEIPEDKVDEFIGLLD